MENLIIISKLSTYDLFIYIVLIRGSLVKRIKVSVGAILMLASMMISDRTEIFILYIFSATLHECGHLLAAMLLKIRIKEIKFEFSGVRICTDEALSSYKGEFLLAAAGPFVNLICLTISVAYFSLLGINVEEASLFTEAFLFDGGYTTVGAVGFFALSALLQGGINLLPVASFDGGRMLYCIVAMFFSEKAAQRLLNLFSSLCALVLWIVALYLLIRIGSGLGIYVFATCLFALTAKDAFDSSDKRRMNGSASVSDCQKSCQIARNKRKGKSNNIISAYNK